MNIIRNTITATLCLPLIASAGVWTDAKAKVAQDAEEKAVRSMEGKAEYGSAVRKYRSDPNRAGLKCYLDASEHWKMWTGMPKDEFAACAELVSAEIQAIHGDEKQKDNALTATIAQIKAKEAEKDARIEEEERELDRTAGPLILNTSLGDMRPSVVHFPDRSCMSKHLGNETFLSCGEYQKIAGEMEAENARIDRQIRDDARFERRQRVAKVKSKSELAQRLAETDANRRDANKALADQLFATAPKGWACVQKRLPAGKDILDSTDKDEAACAKAFKGKQN